MALMFYLIYKITNTVNGKIYIGSHKTKNQNDGYMGSGKYLNHSFNKHGLDKFVKEILFVFDNPSDMYTKEAEIVNDEFLAEENTYNLKRGGFGGFDYINTSGKKYKREFTDDDRKKSVKVCKERFSFDDYSQRNIASHQVSKETKLQWNAAGRAATLAQSAKEKRKETFNRTQHQQGENNSQAGTMWVTNGLSNKKIKKTDAIPNGWNKGRVIKGCGDLGG